MTRRWWHRSGGVDGAGGPGATGIDAARPALAERGGGIVVLSSSAALAPENPNPVYTLGKAAVLGYLRAFAGPLRPSGITVNAVCPAFVDTALLG
ncbi:MAG: SDR family oxidoreductase [Micromonosporaceae bacterium]